MALTDRDTSLNYLGELFMVGAKQTPFLNMIGGVNGANAKKTASMIFPVGQTWTPEAAAIPAIDEDEFAGTAPEGTTTARTQLLNTIMPFRQVVQVSDLRQEMYGELSGLSALGDQPVKDEFAFQKMARLKKMALDMEKSFLSGVYAEAADSSTPAQTRGIITASTVNTVAAGSVKVTKALMDQLFQEMADNGALFENIVVWCNSFNKRVISDIYGYVPESRTEGGANIQRIMSDFCEATVMYDPQIPTDTILVADMNYISPVFSSSGLKFEEYAKVGGSRKGAFSAVAGIDYGLPQNFGTLTGTATS